MNITVKGCLKKQALLKYIATLMRVARNESSLNYNQDDFSYKDALNQCGKQQ